MGQKEAFQQGEQYLESVDLTLHKGPAVVKVRPVTETESALVDQIQQKGLKAPIDLVTFQASALLDDLGDYMVQMSNAKLQLVAYGLSHSGETWSPEEVGVFTPAQVTALHRVVSRISGLRIVTKLEDLAPGGSTFQPGDHPGTNGTGEGAGDAGAGVEPNGNPVDQEPV